MILGPILWSPKTGTQYRGAFVVPISYLIKSHHFLPLLAAGVIPAGTFMYLSVD